MKIEMIINLDDAYKNEEFSKERMDEYKRIIKYLNKSDHYRLTNKGNDGYTLTNPNNTPVLNAPKSMVRDHKDNIGDVSKWHLSDINIIKTNKYAMNYITIIFTFVEYKRRIKKPFVFVDKDLYSDNKPELTIKTEKIYRDILRGAKNTFDFANDHEEYPLLPGVHEDTGRIVSSLIVNLMLKCLNRIVIVDSLTMRSVYSVSSNLEIPGGNRNIFDSNIQLNYKRPKYTKNDAIQLLGFYMRINEKDLENSLKISKGLDQEGDYVLICMKNISIMSFELMGHEIIGAVRSYYSGISLNGNMGDIDLMNRLKDILLKLTIAHELGHLVFSYQNKDLKTNQRNSRSETQANFIASLFSNRIESMTIKAKTDLQPERYRDLLLNIKNAEVFDPSYNDRASDLFFEKGETDE